LPTSLSTAAHRCQRLDVRPLRETHPH
jgi:hypothetical protein